MRATLALLGVLLVALMIPAAPAAPSDVIPVTHEEMGRAFDDFAAQLHGLGERFRRHFSMEAGAERLKADFRVGRVRAIERAKAQLTPEQRAKLHTMLGEPQTTRPRAQSF